MSIGSLGIISGLAGSQVDGSKAAGTDRAARDSAEQSREIDSSQKAEKTAGVGQTDKEQESSDRDADGHLSWDASAHGRKSRSSARSADDSSEDQNGEVAAKDPSGELGCGLDISG